MGVSEIAAIIGALGALAAAATSIHNSGKIQEVHVALNSRLTELLSSTATLAREQGAALGRSEGRRDTIDARNQRIIDNPQE